MMRKFEQPTLKSCTLATVLTWRTHLSKTYIHLIVLTEFVSREISRTDYFHVLHVSDFTHILVPSGFESKYRTKSSTVIGYIARCIEKKYMKACLRVHHTLEFFGSYSTRRRNRARALNVRSGSTLPRRHEKIFYNDIYRITSLRYIEFGFCCNIVVTRDDFERFSSQSAESLESPHSDSADSAESLDRQWTQGGLYFIIYIIHRMFNNLPISS